MISRLASVGRCKSVGVDDSVIKLIEPKPGTLFDSGNDIGKLKLADPISSENRGRHTVKEEAIKKVLYPNFYLLQMKAVVQPWILIVGEFTHCLIARN